MIAVPFCTSSTLSEAPYANLSSHVIFYYTRRYGQSKPLVIRSKRNVYQYPEAAAFAIDLGFRMESDPELQKEFCDYISSVSTNHSLSIFLNFIDTLALKSHQHFTPMSPILSIGG